MFFDEVSVLFKGKFVIVDGVYYVLKNVKQRDMKACILVEDVVDGKSKWIVYYGYEFY